MGDFAFVPVPIDRYVHFTALKAEEEAGRIAALLEQLGGRHDPWDAAERDLSSVNRRLRSWAHPSAPRSSMLYWAGHGETLPVGAWLAAQDSPSPMTDGAVNAESFAEFVAAEWRIRQMDETAWALVVVEACGAQRFAELLYSKLLTAGGMDRVAVVGAAAGNGSGYLGRFRQALEGALAGYSDNDATVQLRDLVGRVERRLGDQGWVQDRGLFRAEPLMRRPLAGPVTAPLDVHAQLQTFLAALSPDERGHFLPKAQGAEHGELAWYFVGRQEETGKIVRWLREQDTGMLVVTGEAGTGKSALLGNLLMRSRPALSSLLERAGMIDPADARHAPPPDVFDAVLHLTGATATEVVQRLADGLALEGVVDTVRPVLQALQRRPGPYTVLADALDEAQEPLAIARDVLAGLAEVDGVRVVVGTRASTKEGPDAPAVHDTDLLDALGGADGRSTRITVGRDRAAAAEYVRRRLDAAFPDDVSEHKVVSEEIGARDRPFLYARLALHELIARPELLSPAQRSRRARLLAHDYRALFASAADRLSLRSPAFGPLLEALSCAAGRGLPRADLIWLTAARALSPNHTVRADVDELSLDALLEEAAPYVMLDAEDGQSVYRLAHRTFEEHYAAAKSARPGRRHRRIAEALATAADAALPARPNPYVVHHLPTHVAQADAWHLLADRPHLVDQLSPNAVAVQAVRARGRGAALPGAIAAVCAAHPRLSRAVPAERGALRALVEARQSGRLPDPNRWRSASSAWQPLWAEFSTLQSPGTRVFTVDGGCLTGLTILRGDGGRPLVALLDDGEPRRIHLWDPVTLEPVAEPYVLPHDATGNQLLAVPTAEGHDRIALPSWRGLHIWDPADWRRVGKVESGLGLVPVRRLAAVCTGEGETFIVHAPSYPSREVHFQSMRTLARTVIGLPHGECTDVIATQREDGSPEIVVAVQGDTTTEPCALAGAPVPTRLADTKSYGGAVAVPDSPDHVIVLANSGHRGRIHLRNTVTGTSTPLPSMGELPDHGGFGVARGTRGETLLISLTTKGQTVTITEVTDHGRRSEQGGAHRGSDVWALRTPAHGEVFAFRTAREVELYAAATGSLVAREEAWRLLGLERDLPQYEISPIWSETEELRHLVHVILNPGDASFRGPDGKTRSAEWKDRSAGLITCPVDPRHVAWWRRWGVVRDGIRTWKLGGRFSHLDTAVEKPGGGALILATKSWTRRERKLGVTGLRSATLVLDTDRPRRIWKLRHTRLYPSTGAALLHIPQPVLGLSDGRSVTLWDVRSRRRAGTFGGGEPITQLTALNLGTAERPRDLLAVSYRDGVLRLWDPTRRRTPVAELDLDFPASAMAASGTLICLLNEEGAVCLDVGGSCGPEQPA
ncbi:hypothetical protein [Streptomyces sp. NPDC058739]|uniref:hypothetical protein n=1 Tax=Streptomyces sp. NPDC058739 TaxID=3346618 RepID=UPI0036CD3E02